MTKQEMKNEAIARMKMLKIYGNAIRDFRKKDRVLNKSEGYGTLYWLNDEEKEAVKNSRKTLWIGGILCGAILFVATNAQQIGIQYTSAGKAGFITALYIVFVPIIGR